MSQRKIEDFSSCGKDSIKDTWNFDHHRVLKRPDWPIAANVVKKHPSGYVDDRLGYLLALIVACLFGRDLLPDVWKKAIFHLSHIGVIAFQFLAKHAFLQDGPTSKKTGKNW